MNKKIADSKVKKVILQLAQKPIKVKITISTYYDLIGLGLTKSDVCDAICDWIKSGKEVQIIITKKSRGHIGKPAYVMKPLIDGNKCYVKVAIQKNTKSQESLLIISTHEHH